jgi:nucleotidyltransferase/DNA polymerase involved in DNA repair
MFATIYLPNFYLQAATRHQPELHAKPVALIEEQERKPVIIQLNDAAEKAGIRKGMTPSQALARSLQVVIKVRAPAQEKSMQEILLHYAFTLSPFVENTAPGVCTIQFTKGNRHPLARRSRLAKAAADNRLARHGEFVHWRTGSQCHDNVLGVIEQLAKCEIAAQAAIAPTPDTSFLAAHLARPVLQIENAKEFLAPMPIETLATSSPDFL